VNREGIAQLVVLWALLLLGTLAMSFAFSMRTEAMASRNGLEAERAYYQARTGVDRAIALLSDVPVDNVLRESITGIGEEALKEILRNGGLSGEEAEGLGDAILDWRDEDDEARPRGAEEQDYASLPEPVKPRNGRFASVGELRYVRGVTHEIYMRLLSTVFTVDSGMQSVNVNVAPVEVFRVLPGVTPELAAQAIAHREETPFRSAADFSDLLGTENAGPSSIPVVSTAGMSPVYTITSVGRAGGSVTSVIRCTIGVHSGPNSFKIRRWEDHVSMYEEAG
jgi:general secretion pathway protein K